MKMTVNSGLAIQAAQLIFYRPLIGRIGVKIIRRNTHIYDHINPEEPIDIVVVNAMVPRGGDFERLIKRPVKDTCQETLDWYNASRNGRIYS